MLETHRRDNSQVAVVLLGQRIETIAHMQWTKWNDAANLAAFPGLSTFVYIGNYKETNQGSNQPDTTCHRSRQITKQLLTKHESHQQGLLL
jgi:hypothetical protein